MSQNRMIASLKKDICDILVCICAPEEQDDSEEEYVRASQMFEAQTYFEEKYGDDIIDRIRALVHEIPTHIEKEFTHE